MHWILPDRVFDGDDFKEAHALCVQDARVSDMQPASSLPDDAVVERVSGLMTAGFFDVQVNGGGGVLFNTSPTTSTLETIASAHRQFGTTGILPTVITDHVDVLDACVDAILSIPRSHPSILGLHIEGPHIALAKRGTHAARHIRPLDAFSKGLMRRLRDAQRPVLLTLAPEVVSVADIRTLVEMGVVVSLGHSNASFEQTQAALTAGATAFTHMFNAMPPLHHRVPGMVGAALESDAWCSVIADGIHVHPSMLALACRARPCADRMIAVSDAMATLGGPDAFELYGETIQLQNNRLINRDGALAGAHLSLGVALRNLISFGVQPADALRMCQRNPLEMMGLGGRGDMLGMRASDLLLLDDSYTVQAVGLPFSSPRS